MFFYGADKATDATSLKNHFMMLYGGLWVYGQLNSANPLKMSVQLFTAEGSSDEILISMLSLSAKWIPTFGELILYCVI